MLKKTAKDFIESENKSRKQTYYKDQINVFTKVVYFNYYLSVTFSRSQ